ncbi:polysaccharide biosynthesis tyrosine autokinase, partial [Pseudomonas sp.]|uniref:polysaccharide biosynthesis tyrosine autokinase n=1 Tax=Pseudomonas sp. TaxID=306 RepID=UPI00272C5D4B
YRVTSVIQIEPPKPGVASFSEVERFNPAEPLPAQPELQFLRSASVIGAAVDALQLNVRAEPMRFPLIGGLVARRFEERAPGALNEPVMGLARYGWGGEELLLRVNEIPDRLRGRRLTLIAGPDEQYYLQGPEGETLLSGAAGETATAAGLSLEVFTLHARPGTAFRVVVERPLSTALRIQEKLEVVELGEKSGVLALSLYSSEPEQAARSLNAIVDAYLHQNTHRSASEISARLEFLQGQLPQMRSRLERAEHALNAYQAEARSVDISLEIQGILAQIVELDKQISELQLERADIARRFTAGHFAHQTVVSQISGLQARQQQLMSKLETLPRTQQELIRLRRDVEVSNELYMLMLNRAQELDVARQSSIGNAQVVDRAVFDADNPVKPHKLLILAGGTLAGFALAVGFLLLYRALYPSLGRAEEIERLGLPVYASIPFTPGSAASRDYRAGRGESTTGPARLAEYDPEGPGIEALRNLRTSLHFSMLRASNNRVMITGPTPFVGKSFLAANLAEVVAQAGRRVLLIDADMRRGHLHQVFGVERKPGLSNVLAGEASLAAVLQGSARDDLFFLPRGETPANPSELLMHSTFTALLDEASALFDMVIIDTPPLLAVTDAAIIGQQAGTNLLVARFEFTAPQEVEQCLRSFAHNGIEFSGAIFNSVEKRAATTYGYSPGYHRYDYRPDSA